MIKEDPICVGSSAQLGQSQMHRTSAGLVIGRVASGPYVENCTRHSWSLCFRSFSEKLLPMPCTQRSGVVVRERVTQVALPARCTHAPTSSQLLHSWCNRFCTENV